MEKYSVLIIEDHAVFGKVLISFLKRDSRLQILGPIQSGEEALEKLPELDVDLAVIDVSLPQMSGIDLLKKIHEKYPSILCMMLSGHMTSVYVKRSIEAGARGYVLKDDVHGILEGIKRILNGEIYLSEVLRDENTMKEKNNGNNNEGGVKNV